MRVVIITRQLNNHEKVISKVYSVPSDVNHVESYADYMMKMHQQEFVERFVEFKNAVFEWNIQLVF